MSYPIVDPLATRGEIINPSDTYSIDISDPKLAFAAVNIVSGMLFLQDEKGESISFTDADYLEGWVNEHRADLSRVMRSVVVGNAYEYAAKSAALPEAEREAFWNDWDDKHRSSLNRIGHGFLQYADHFAKEEAPA